MKIFDSFKQNTPGWWAIRRGTPTASEFSRIITPVTAKASASQADYLDELVSQLLDQQYGLEPENQYISPAMQCGIDGEPAARAWYEFEYDCQVRQVGFCMSDCGRYGCSPDGLIGDDCCMEIKTPQLKAHIRYLREGVLPADYRCQCHGELAVTGAKELVFISYSPVPELENFVIRVKPDAFTEKLKSEVELFCDKLDTVLAKFNLKRAIHELD